MALSPPGSAFARRRLGISVLFAALRGEPTGQPQGWRGDVVAVAKRDLTAAEMLDGEGGYTVWGNSSPPSAALPRAHCRSASLITSG
jgi:predicted homoserine dehydrogenase-like protein